MKLTGMCRDECGSLTDADGILPYAVLPRSLYDSLITAAALHMTMTTHTGRLQWLRQKASVTSSWTSVQPIPQNDRAVGWQDMIPRLKVMPVLRRIEHHCSTCKVPTHTAEKLRTCCIFTQAVALEKRDHKLLTMQSLCRDTGYKLLMMRACVETQHVMPERARPATHASEGFGAPFTVTWKALFDSEIAASALSLK